MQHLVLKATTVSTHQELGQFEAVVSSWEADRQGDTIEHDAFDKTIAAWQQSDKQLPLLFAHSTQAVGSIDPFSMHPTDGGLVVYGEVDRSTEEGQQVWRQIKSGSVGFSIGFMAKSRDTKDGGRVLTEIDLLEISATSTPAHPATRVLGWKTNAASTSEWERLRKASLKLQAEHDQRHRDRELKRQRDEELLKFISEAKVEAEKQAKRSRPITVKRFKVG